MSKKDMLVTYAYKKTKNHSIAGEKSKVVTNVDVLPSSSKPYTDKNLEVLKAFDLNLEYGPCVGITRLERWERAHKHQLNPDPNIKQLLLAHDGDDRYTLCLWNNYKNII